MKNLAYQLILTVIMGTFWISCSAPKQQIYDIVIYGGTSAGVSAAIQASRMGKTVLLIEPSTRLGGLTTGGLGQTDIGNKSAIGGISREFYEGIKQHYDNPDHWIYQSKDEYQDGGQTRTAVGETAMWTFEPSAALDVYLDMLDQEQIEVIYNGQLDRASGVDKTGPKINSITMLTGKPTGARYLLMLPMKVI